MRKKKERDRDRQRDNESVVYVCWDALTMSGRQAVSQSVRQGLQDSEARTENKKREVERDRVVHR